MIFMSFESLENVEQTCYDHHIERFCFLSLSTMSTEKQNILYVSETFIIIMSIITWTVSR